MKSQDIARFNEVDGRQYQQIGDVRGIGLMNAVEIVKGDKKPDSDRAASIQKYLQGKKILVLTCGALKNVIRFIPPLNIDSSLLNQVVDRFGEALKSS